MKWACIELDTCQGLADMRPGCGALMGDPFAVASFNACYAKPLADFNTSQWSKLGTEALALGCKNPFGLDGKPRLACDLGLTNYADDTTRVTVAAKTEGIARLCERVNTSVELLDASIADSGYSQNKQKLCTCLSWLARVLGWACEN